MRTARTEAIDAKLERFGARMTSLCQEILPLVESGAALPEAATAELASISEEIAHLRHQRDEIIRETFYRPACGSGWTNDRCTKKLGHGGIHSNEGGRS